MIFHFLPIEPPRDPVNRRESFARRQYIFPPRLEASPQSKLSRLPSNPSPTTTETPPSISIDGRLPDPAIITCNESLPLRILVTKLNDSLTTIYVHTVEITLIGHTDVRAHHLRRTDSIHWPLINSSALRMALGNHNRDESGKEMEVDASLWKRVPLPNTVPPSFVTCNLKRYYELDIKIGLSYGSSTETNVRPKHATRRYSSPNRFQY